MEHDITHKQSDCQVTGEAAPLVLIIPVNPLHRHHYTSISTGSCCWRKKKNLNPFTHPTSLSSCPQGWGCSLAMNVRLAVKPPVPAMLGTSYNERHLRRTGKGRQGVREIYFIFSCTCLNPLMGNIAKSVNGMLNGRWKDCKSSKRCLKADESRWEWKLGS